MMRGLLLVAVVGACSDAQPNANARVEALAGRVDNFDDELAEAEKQVGALSSDFAEIAEAYKSVADRYRDAQRSHREVAEHANVSRELSLQAAKDYESAAASLRFVRLVIKAAIQLDKMRARSGQQRGRAEDGDPCEKVSTASYRRQLEARGVDLDGKDIDHIVPRSIGGFDGPANYQVLDSSVNRSLGATWNIAKCAMAGEKCAGAVAVSAKCGSYRGGL